MDQPPSAETQPCPPNATPAERMALGYNAASRLAAGRVEAFVAAAGWLRAQGLSAPAIEAADPAQGLAVLEDLGDDLYATPDRSWRRPLPLYQAAVDAQARMHAASPPEVLEAGGATWPLLTYDRLALKVGTDTFLEWWPKLAGLPPFPAEAVSEWDALWEPVWARGEAGASVFTHRDYHAQNLLWLPGRAKAWRGWGCWTSRTRCAPIRPGTCCICLQDARIDVPAELERAMLDRYLDARPDLDREAFLADYRALAASNAARILGRVFARQTLLGRPQYRAFMPRTWRYLERNLQAPELAGLKAWFDRHVPPEARA